MASTTSSDEGEISEVGLEKATTSLPQYDGPSVDRTDRPRSRYSISPPPQVDGSSYTRRSSDRSRSPYSDRYPRGEKRSRDDDHYDRSGRDPRRFKVHYEDEHTSTSRRQPRDSYRDLDRPVSDTRLRYDDPPRYADKHNRNRSRSPYRRPANENGPGAHRGHKRDASRYGSYAGADKSWSNGYDNGREGESSQQSVSKGAQDPARTDHSNTEAKHDKGYSYESDETRSSHPSRK